MSSATTATITLQNKVTPEDMDWVWSANIPKIPSSRNCSNKVPIKFITVTEKCIELKIEFQSVNRILTPGDNTNFIGISFANFRFNDLPPRVTSDYIERLLKAGIQLNRVKYFFYGNSNSQLKSRTCLLHAADNGEKLFKKINTLGDFSKINSVSKRAKRIGLLFSAAESLIQLDSKFTLDIDDVERDGHIFTDGCGLISKNYANYIAKQTKIIFHNTPYVPSVFQIRYKGYKGTVMLHPTLPKPHHFHFVKSMRKFTDCSNNTFSVLEYSKPYNFGFLNGELVTLLSTLGISDEVFKQKQKNYFDFLKQALSDPITSFMFLSYKGEQAIAENVLLNGIEKSTLSTIKRLGKEEWKGSYDKRNKERVRIFIPLSRLLFGVSDYTGTLNEGEVQVRIKIEGMKECTITNVEVIVARNPCLHPGDIRKFKAVYKEELNHLVDCIVFPIVGERDAPSLMSGGDLDGDKFFVSWDSDIIPEKLYEPYGYPPAKEPPKRDINYESMVKYFAQYNNASLGKVKNLYLEWARVSEDKAGSKECQELNALFSSCVDGERVNIPERLQVPPKPKDGSKPFILDLLCEEVKKHADNIFQNEPEDSANTTPFELMEFLLTSNAVCLDEFELFQLANRWCLYNEHPIENFLPYFNFGAFTLQEKHIVACQFKQRDLNIQYFQSLFNSLHSSKLLSTQQITNQNLHHANIYWQKFYDSSDDDGRRLENCLSKALELFDRKLLVIRVDRELTIAIYIAHKVVQEEELDIGKLRDGVKLFAFSSTGQNYRTLAQRNYKIYFNGNVMQLYDDKRTNTFVWFALQNENFPSNRVREPFRNKLRMENRRHNQVETTKVKPQMPEFKVSIALQKFSGELSKSRSRVNKLESKGVEIYVISNRDRLGHQLLDLSMNQVDTKTIVKLQKNIPKEYYLAEDLECIDWTFREFSKSIILDRKYANLKGLNEIDQFEQILFICETLTDEDVGDSVFSSIVQYVLTEFDSFDKKDEIWVEIFRHLHKFPKASSLLVDKIYESIFRNDDENLESVLLIYPLKEYQCLFLIDNIIHSANSSGELIFRVYEKIVQILIHHEWYFSVEELISQVKSIVYSVRLADVAEKLLRKLFDEEIQIFKFKTSTSENEICFRYLRKFVMTLALNHIGEVKENCPCDFWGIPQGAEEKEDSEDKKDRSYSKPVEKVVIADFMYQVLNAKVRVGNIPSINNINSAPPVAPYRGAKPIPAMKCLEIQPTGQLGFYKTILKTDIQNKIRNGDHLIFCASRRAIDKDKRRVKVFNAIAYSIKRGELIFEMREREPRELFCASWNVYICTTTTIFNAMLAALKALISSKEKSTSAFTSILELPPKPPGKEKEMLKADIPPNKFNEMQSKAIKQAINTQLTLIWGPPGSGKTTVVVEILLQLIQLRGGLSILVAASTHNAVDNVLSRFLKERARRFGDYKSEDVVRITSDMDKITIPELQKWTLNAFVGADIHTNDKAKKEALKRLQNSRVVFSTCSGAGVGLLRLPEDDGDDGIDGRKKKKQKEKSFDVVIVDEASQITEPNALIPIVKQSMFVILVGDHVQLRPTVSQVAKDSELETSLFEKLYLSKNLSDYFCSKIMLNVQYRMNPLLAQFPSNTFYDGELLSGISEERRIIPASKFPWPKKGENNFPAVFIQCPSPENYGTGSTSKMNIGQVKLTIDIIKRLTSSASSGDSESQQPIYSITVLSPYTKQVAEIQSRVKAANLKADVKTIDSFQGRESDIIIYSTVRANLHNDLGFLDDRRRMNVALTRAKLGLILIGEESTLSGNDLWKKCIESCEKVVL